jgi:hypothetical protein
MKKETKILVRNKKEHLTPQTQTKEERNKNKGRRKK